MATAAVAVAAATAAAAIHLIIPPFIKKLASKLGGDITPDEMEDKKIVVSCLIEELIRNVKHDDSDKSKQLLKKLQTVSLELDDLSDIYEYDQLEKQVNSSSNPIKKLIPIIKEMLGPILPKSTRRYRLEKLLEFLEQVEKLEQLITSKTDTTQPQADTITPTTSTFSPPYFGRVDQCKGIINFLLHDSRANNIPVIAITGIEGSGKTHTAQLICSDDRIENHFDANILWVHVTRNLDVVGLTRKMLEFTTDNGHYQITSPEVLMQKLIKSLSNGKKYLFVFDDVWCEDVTTWDKLVGPLKEAVGSKIIVTTRSETIAQKLGAEVVELGNLDDRDCWSIIKNYASPNSLEITDDQGLSYVKNKIVSKVKESPLTLRAVASSSITEGSVDKWMEQLEKVTLEVTMKFLYHSYIRLPSHLKRCFAYCSLFPKGYKFYIDFHKEGPHLISLWIAQGYIGNTGELTLGEAGKNYIEELVSKSFFEKESKDYFVIPDLLHDLADTVSKDICHRVECHGVESHGSVNIPAGCLHLSFCTTENFVSPPISDMKAKISKLTNLQTLIILGGPVPDDIFQNGEGILPKLKNLHALYVHPDQLMGVQSIHRIDELKLLRYLHVQYGQRLPDSLAKLYFLKIFILITDQVNDHKYLKKDSLPKDFDKLINLRTLKFYASCGNELDYLYHNSEIIDVSKLKLLQNLIAFHPDKEGSKGMMALRNLSLCGSLSVLNLEKVQSKEEAGLAMLNQKKRLNELIFEWSSISSDNSNNCAEVLEGLKPHDNLKKLEILGYRSVTFPDWMIRLPRLEILTLRPCTIHEIVSSFPPCPQSLRIYDNNELMQLSFVGETGHTLNLYDVPKSELPSMFNRSLGLRRLTIRRCSIDVIDLSSLTNLEYLDLTELPNLQTITNLSPTLAKLSILGCSKLSSMGNLQGCTSLEWLTIYKCPTLRREEPSSVEGVAQGDIANRLPQVKYVYTDELLLVRELVQQQAFSFIAHLTLKDSATLPNLEILSSLKNLCIEDCPDFGSLRNLPVSLRSLWIDNCRDVESLQNLPVSLQLLWVDGCPKLKEKYEEGGPLRNTISHIPVIYIS